MKALTEAQEARVRELEWAATYVKTHPYRSCRCASTCSYCRQRKENADKITPDVVLELIGLIREGRDR